MQIKYQEKTMEIDKPITIKELLKDEIEKNEYRVVAAKFNNEYKNLQFQIEEDGIIELIDLSQKEGMKVYVRTLTFIAGKAFTNLLYNLIFQLLIRF